MPKDITSYFKPLSKTKEKAPPKIDLSDDDVIPESPDVQIKSKKKVTKKKRGRVIDDSSDEEIFTKKKYSTVDEKKSSHSSKDKKPDKKLQEMKPADLFSSGPIKRTEPLVKKVKKEPKTEIGIHDDEDFEKSLLEIDNIEDLVNGECSKSKNEKSSAENTESIKNVKKVDATFIESNHLEVNGINDKKENCPRKDEITSNKKDKSPKKLKTITSPKKEKDNEIAKPGKLANYKIPKTPSAENKHKHNKEEEEKTVKNEKSKTEDHNGSVAKNSDKKDSPSSSKNRKREDYVASKMNKKRDFSEFIGEDEPNHDDDEQESKNKSKKKKLDTSLNSSVLSDEERHERKRHSALLYQSYLNRSGPKNLGAKEIPKGAPNCLKDCAFLLTGVLDSFEREEITEAISKYGGCIKSGVTKKVTHVLAGNDAGPAKLAKAQDLGIRVISEDDFLQMIRDSTKTSKDVRKNKNVPSGSTEQKNDNEERSDIKPKRDNSSESKSKPKSAEKPKVASEEKMKSFEDKIRKSFYSKTKDAPISIDSSPEKDVKPKPNSSVSKTEVKSKPEETPEPSCSKQSEMKKEPSVTIPAPNSLMWVDKYKPQSVKQIIGQHGDASNAKKLINWLTKWYLSRREKIPKPSPWAKNDDGAYYKAVLLSGPPGVGKTTTVSLVCKEMGFDLVEFNASDTRSKTLIKEQIGELLTTTSLSGFAKGDTGKKAVSKKHVLVMDEVDGMAGNEDRGGLQELISLIKTTSVPVICMCNDRNSEKMRSLVNYCYDLKFAKPRVDQIKSAMLSVCCKERIKISPDTLARLIASCNQDVRQTLNALSLWAVDLDSNKLSDDADSVRKDLKLGPWDALRKVFSAEEHKRMSINDKSDLFFYDYSLAPLFVHENYLSVAPHCDKKQVLSRLAQAADSLSLGDTVEKRIRSSQAWNLLPLQAMLSSVIPGSVLSGHVAGQIQFPGWLGKNSRANKMNRLAQEIHAHTRLSTTGSKSSIYLDYSKHLRDAIVTPLIREKADGIPRSIQVLNDYHLLREDLDSLTELAMWPGQRDPMLLVDFKIKAAMTRAYNKQAPAQPHAAASFTRGKRKEREGGDEADADESERDSEPENDGMIKVKKTNAPKGKDKEDKPGTSKGKKGKGKK